MFSALHNSSNLRRLIYWLLAAELSLFTIMRSEFGNYLSPVLLYISGVLACLATYYYTRHHSWNQTPSDSASRRSPWLVIVLIALLGTWLCANKVQEVINNYLIQISSSDIIPALSIYAKRFLNCEEVYTPFTQELGYFALPTYLPATWFPYLLPEWLRFDYRWMSSALLEIGVIGYLVVIARMYMSAYNTAILASLPFVLTYATIRTEASIFGFTVECMIIGYYFLLLTGILLRSWPLQVVALTLCLLSRFSLVVWGPLYFFLVFFQESRQRALGLLGALAASVLVFYVLPFLSHDWGLFMRVQASYTDVAVGEWLHLNEQGKPYHLYNGVGLGNFFYRFGAGELVDRIRLLKRVHIVLISCISIGAGWLYWRQRAPRTDYRIYAILVLKLYLITFYAFIQVPYSYLAAVGIFVSLFLLLLISGTTPTVLTIDSNKVDV